MLPPAPDRFSTTTGCPSDLPRPSATTREMMSVVVPGPNGTTSFTGREGKSWAEAPEA